MARANAERLGLPLEVEVADGLPPGEYDLVIANLPYVRDDRWEALMPEINRYEPRVALTGGVDGLDMIRELVEAVPVRNARRARARRGPGGRDPRDARGRRLVPGPRGLGPHHRRPRALTPEDVETFERCISVGGVALFPADTVYGLATEPDSREGVDRLYRLKGRLPDKPSAVMFFRLESALAALPELGAAHARDPRVPAARAGDAAAAEPGAPLPARLRAGAGQARPAGARARRRAGAARGGELAGAPVEREPVPVRPEARRVEEVAPELREGVDLILDAGELPGTPSTVIDLSAWESGGTFEVVREGALPLDAVVRCLR